MQRSAPLLGLSSMVDNKERLSILMLGEALERPGGVVVSSRERLLLTAAR